MPAQMTFWPPMGLAKLHDHATTAVASFVFFLLVQLLTPIISRRWTNGLDKKSRKNWPGRVVSMVHVSLVVPLAFRCLGLEALETDRAFGWDYRSGLVQSVAVGYFLWDVLETITNFSGIAFAAHGISCLTIYTITTFKPFLSYYAVRFLLWETSTFFLNIHWFLDKTGHGGSKLQFVNDLALLGTFFGIRIVWGAKMSLDAFHTVEHSDISSGPKWVILGGNVALQTLNWVWFTKMMLALREKKSVTATKTPPSKEIDNVKLVSQ